MGCAGLVQHEPDHAQALNIGARHNVLNGSGHVGTSGLNESPDTTQSLLNGSCRTSSPSGLLGQVAQSTIQFKKEKIVQTLRYSKITFKSRVQKITFKSQKLYKHLKNKKLYRHWDHNHIRFRYSDQIHKFRNQNITIRIHKSQLASSEITTYSLEITSFIKSCLFENGCLVKNL
jgi:hypothetical protein